MLGLGHLGLSLALAEALAATDESSTALVLTGSPAFAGMRVPERVDVVKLPTMPVDSGSRWGATALRPPARLAIPIDEVAALRSRLYLASVTELRPDVAVVDYRPLGREHDLRPALEWLRGAGCTVALGLWEVDDAPERLRRDWTDELAEAVAELYDLALVYGPSSPDDVRVEALRAAGVPVHNTGRVAAPPASRSPADLEDGYLLATTGGGGDGFELLEALLDAVRLRPLGFPAVLVTGPMMSPERVELLRERATGLDARVERFRPDMGELLAGARAVVSMAGYCTVAEVLASGKPALLVPRAFPREEQLNRARRLAAEGRVDMLDPAAAEPQALRQAIDRLLERDPAAPEPPTGAADAAAILASAVSARTA